MRHAIARARDNVRSGGGGPFAALVVREGEILAEAVNLVAATNDPTAHAEVLAIREACIRRKSFSLAGCAIYTTCEPCPMCLAAILWSRAEQLFFAATRQDAASAGFDDEQLYRRLGMGHADSALTARQVLRDEALVAFREWAAKPDKVLY